MMYIAGALGVLFVSLWIIEIVFFVIHTKWTNNIISSGEEDEDYNVSVIHPIKDLDYQLEENMESWFNQNYKGKIEHIFSFQDSEDEAIPVIEKLLKKYSNIDGKIIINDLLKGINGKSSNMVHGVRVAKYNQLVFGDSDTTVNKDFLVKMVRPLKDKKNGIVTCGQTNRGGKTFWTRFFTFLQNNETDFIWALMTKLGMDMGATGAAFSMRRETLEEVGGLEAYGDSILEDFHLGSTLYKEGYKLVLGPFIICNVDKFESEKALNYAKKICVGIMTHISFEMPAFFIMLAWYWILLIISIVTANEQLFVLSLGFVLLRVIHGLAQRYVAEGKIKPIDIVMGPGFDLFGTFYLLYSLNKPFISWRGIEYRVKPGGYIVRVDEEEEEEN